MSDIIDITESAVVLPSSRVSVYFELTKARIAGMVLVATAVGFFLALPASMDAASARLLLLTLLGTGFVGGAANALNQSVEAAYDARMHRTAGRPVPSGRLSSGEAMVFALATCGVGLAILFLLVNPLAGALAALTFFSYGFVYTPLKRVTSMAVFVGAVPGALPPVIGWAAASGTLDLGTWLLFVILFFWQLPHFAAIAWMYRDDYARAGFPMIPVNDPVGTRTNFHIITHAVALLTASLLPVFYGMAGSLYALSAVVFGLAFLAQCVVFIRNKTRARARACVIGSVIYLPLLFFMMMLDKLAVQ